MDSFAPRVEPVRHVLSVALNPGCIRTNLVQSLGKNEVKLGHVLRLEERLRVRRVRLASEVVDRRFKKIAEAEVALEALVQLQK